MLPFRVLYVICNEIASWSLKYVGTRETWMYIRKLHGFGDLVMYFDVLYLNSNWFLGVIWVISLYFDQLPLLPGRFRKLEMKVDGILQNGRVSKYVCQSTKACNKIIPELIRTLRVKQNNFLKYRNRCQSRLGYILDLPHTVLQYVIYTVVGGNAFFQNVFLCSNFNSISLATVLKMDL